VGWLNVSADLNIIEPSDFVLYVEPGDRTNELYSIFGYLRR
jgi:hypothetical protein